jgi:aminopeptidase YwaD
MKPGPEEALIFSAAEQAMRHLVCLARDIGVRAIGSPGNHAAADYISACFQEAGLPVEIQEFPCPDWSELPASLELDGEALEAAANTFSPACDLVAQTVPIGTLEELESTEITGRVPIFYGALAQHELAAKGAIYLSERDRRIIQLLEERHPAGLVTVNPSLYGRWRLVEDYDLDVPSVTVTARSGLKLLERSGETVHLQIAARRAPGHSANVIGRLQGARPERIVLCAHYDTKVDTPGAYDNAAGVAVLLSLAYHLAQAGNRYTLEFLAFSGEEIYGLGDMEYARRLAGGFSAVAAAINFDGIGPRLAANSLAVFAASRQFEELVKGARKAFPGVVEVDPWPASDHYIFYSNGVPSLALSSVGIQDIYHTPLDTVEWISPDKLAEVISLTLEILRALEGEEAEKFRPHDPD